MFCYSSNSIPALLQPLLLEPKQYYDFKNHFSVKTYNCDQMVRDEPFVISKRENSRWFLEMPHKACKGCFPRGGICSKILKCPKIEHIQFHQLNINNGIGLGRKF